MVFKNTCMCDEPNCWFCQEGLCKKDRENLEEIKADLSKYTKMELLYRFGQEVASLNLYRIDWTDSFDGTLEHTYVLGMTGHEARDKFLSEYPDCSIVSVTNCGDFLF